MKLNSLKNWMATSDKNFETHSSVFTSIGLEMIPYIVPRIIWYIVIEKYKKN